jgi:hypothetical protein
LNAAVHSHSEKQEYCSHCSKVLCYCKQFSCQWIACNPAAPWNRNLGDGLCILYNAIISRTPRKVKLHNISLFFFNNHQISVSSLPTANSVSGVNKQFAVNKPHRNQSAFAPKSDGTYPDKSID